MISLMNLSMVLIMLILMVSSNPVKMSVVVLACSGVIFMKMGLMSGNLWVYCIFFLLMMGGILVLFMIISSLMPNNLLKKTNWSKTIPLVMVAATFWARMESTSENLIFQLKWSLMSKTFMMSMILVMMCYFFAFLEILGKSMNPMRSFYC